MALDMMLMVWRKEVRFGGWWRKLYGIQ